jgi:sporulation protein YlmC with PRC-barrel domain
LWEKETFFQLNRWILITCLLLSFGLPWLSVPEEWSLQNRVAQQEVSVEEKMPISKIEPTIAVKAPILEEKKAVIETAEKAIDAPVIATKPLIDTKKEAAPTKAAPLWSQGLNINYWQLLQYVYLIGLAIFVLNFLIQLMLIFFQKATNPTLKDGRYTIVEINQDKAPFSFGNWIFINPTKYDWDTYNQILSHEKIHIQQRHTFDILLAELVIIIQWFNPFAWLYRKAVENNLEYLTDYEMLYQGTERKAYQMNLLRVSVPQLPLNLTTNYNQSFLKKRIAMMNVKKSSASSSWKYLLLLPLLALTVITLNPIYLKSQNPVTEPVENKKETQQEPVKTIKTEKEEALKKEEVVTLEEPIEEAEAVKEEQTIVGITEDENTYAFKGNVSFDGDNDVVYKGRLEMNGEILNLATTGNWSADVEDNEVCFQFMHSRKYRSYNFSMGICFAKNALQPTINRNSEGPFKMTREAGVLTLKGDFENGEGFGKYSFEESADFRTYLEGEGYNRVDEDLMFHVFLTNINKSYLAFLKKEGYGELSMKEFKALAHHQMSQEQLKAYLDGLNRMNFDKPDLDELLELAIHDVSLDYIQKMGRELFKDLSIRQIVEASIHDVDPEYIKEVKSLGYEDMKFRDIIEFSIHDIDSKYVKELKDSGLKLTKKEIVEAAIHNVDADFIKEVRALGYDDIAFRDIVEFSIHNIDADYVKELKDAGLDLTKKEIVEAAIHNIDADFIKEVKAMGYDDIAFRDIVEFGIHNINTRYIKELKDSGLDLNKKEIVEAAIHNIDADFIKEVKALGYDDMQFKDIVEFGIHNIDARYIKELKDSGLKLNKKQIVEAAIHHVDANFIKEVKALGYDDLTFKDILEFNIHHVDARFVKKMREAGYDNLTARELIAGKIHNVDPDDVEAFKGLGFGKIPLKKLIELKIHNVTPSFIKRVRKNDAFEDLTLDDYIDMKIHGFDRKLKRQN